MLQCFNRCTFPLCVFRVPVKTYAEFYTTVFPKGLTDLFPVCLAPAPPGLFGASCRLSSPHDSCLHRLIYSRSPVEKPNTAESPETSPRFVRLHGTSQHLSLKIESPDVWHEFPIVPHVAVWLKTSSAASEVSSGDHYRAQRPPLCPTLPLTSAQLLNWHCALTVLSECHFVRERGAVVEQLWQRSQRLCAVRKLTAP